MRPGLILLIALLVGAGTLLSYRYATRATRINDEAVEIMNSGNYEKALELLDLAQTIEPDNVEVNLNRGICLAERHRYDESLQSFERAITLAPDNALGHFNKGYLLHHQNKYPEAVAPLQQAVALDPEYADAWLLLGECQYELFLDRVVADPKTAGNPREAEEAFRKYLGLKPGGGNRKAIEQKLSILAKPEDFPSVLDKHRERLNPTKPEPLPGL